MQNVAFVIRGSEMKQYVERFAIVQIGVIHL